MCIERAPNPIRVVERCWECILTVKDSFLSQRVHALPKLGLGVSTEFGAFRQSNSLNIAQLFKEYPQFAQFLEIGVEREKGLDDDALRWIANGLKTTYHFLDINLSQPELLDKKWLREMKTLVDRMEAAWVCGDAGLWFFGQRHPLHMTLLPPILCRAESANYAESIRICRDVLGKEVLPENPPGTVFVGDLDLLSFYADVCERADTGMLLDAAHLSIYQSLMGRDPLDGLADFPTDRIIEIHVAGSRLQMVDGLEIWTDDHYPTVRPETWKIVEFLAERTPNLKAVVFECERNPMEACIEGFQRISTIFADGLVQP